MYNNYRRVIEISHLVVKFPSKKKSDGVILVLFKEEKNVLTIPTFGDGHMRRKKTQKENRVSTKSV